MRATAFDPGANPSGTAESRQKLTPTRSAAARIATDSPAWPATIICCQRNAEPESVELREDARSASAHSVGRPNHAGSAPAANAAIAAMTIVAKSTDGPTRALPRRIVTVDP